MTLGWLSKYLFFWAGGRLFHRSMAGKDILGMIVKSQPGWGLIDN
jgi:hypothetical protein